MILLLEKIVFMFMLFILQVTVSKNNHYVERRGQCGNSGCKGPKIRIGPKNESLSLGETRTLKCKAFGDPPPTITWQEDGVRIDPQNRNYKITNIVLPKNKKMVKSQIRISALSKQTIYTCIASNSVNSVRSFDSYVTVNPVEAGMNPYNIGSYDSTERNRCIPYQNRSTCSPYLDPTRAIYTKNGEDSFLMLEKLLTSLISYLQRKRKELSPSCRPHVLPFLCYYNFPYCENDIKKPMKRIICRKDCVTLSKDYCHREFTLAKLDETIRTLIPGNCLSLPTENCISMDQEIRRVQGLSPKEKVINHHNRKSTAVNTINNLHNHKSTAVDTTDNCFFGKGEHYRGIVNTTESNLPCETWSNSLEGSQNVDLFGHNYCRNIDSAYDRPWCHVRNDRKSEVQYCDVPRCAAPLQNQATNILYTIIPCLVFALALSLAVIMVAWKRHKQHYYQSATCSPKQVVPRVNPKIQELNREDLCDFRLLGDGSLGRVYTADFTGCKDGKTYTACVAVKAIIEKATSKQIEDFVREAETRANFKHENVISLIGVISNEEPLSLIYEYTEYGDLHEYLLRHSPNFSEAHTNDGCGQLEYSDLIVISTQIASGMSYLSTHAFLHRDLAARNCLVTDGGIIKISDFSGLRDLYAGDYYRAPGRPPLPVRWMSPEAISQSKLTSASDVWSYGIVLWEIFSYGSRPFFGLSNYQALKLIAEYELSLPCPDGCSSSIFSLMQECWGSDIELRPTFVELYNRLKSMSGITNTSTQQNMSVASLSTILPISNGYISREVQSNPFHRPSLSSSQSHSLHSGHSSAPSTSSGHHPASIHSASHSIPQSLLSISHSVPSSLIIHQIQNRNAHYNLPYDGCQSSHENQCQLTHQTRPASANGSSLHRSSGAQSNSYLPPGSYISSLHSYPTSAGCPPTMFSRQTSSRISNHESSGYDSIKRGHNQSNIGHIYL